MTAAEHLPYIINDTSKMGQAPLKTRVSDPAFHPQMSSEACSANWVKSGAGKCLPTHPIAPFYTLLNVC